MDQINMREQTLTHPMAASELHEITETEVNTNNGGGSFHLRQDPTGDYSIRYESDTPTTSNRPVGAPGEIGSPIMGNGGLSRFPVAHPPPGF